MKIAISGAHSQGKTTLLNDLKIRNEFRKFSFLGNITRGIKERGVEINEGGSDFSQSLVIAKHIEHLFTRGGAILDRCILDGVVYTYVLRNQGKISQEVMDYAIKMFQEMIGQYDFIFYVMPELPLVTDNIRTTDIQFFGDVVNTFSAFILEYKIPVVQLKGSREERVQTVINTVFAHEFRYGV